MYSRIWWQLWDVSVRSVIEVFIFLEMFSKLSMVDKLLYHYDFFAKMISTFNDYCIPEYGDHFEMFQ